MFLFQIHEEKFPTVGLRSPEEQIFDKQVQQERNKIGGFMVGFIPFVDLPKVYSEMKTAIKNGNEAEFYAAAIMFASITTLDIIDVFSYGSTKTTTTTAKLALREALENPAARKGIYKVIKNNVDELGKYFPDVITFTKSKVYRQLDSYLDDMFSIMNKGMEKFPNAKQKILNALELSKQKIPYKSESNIYSILNRQLENVSNPVRSTYRSMHGQPVSILTIDKGSMWALNALDKSQILGDTALTLYNRSVIKTQTEAIKKFKSGGLSIEAIRTGSDEIIVVINGSNEKMVRDATTFFKEQLEKNLNDFSYKMSEPMQKIFSKVDIIPEHGYLHARKNIFGFTKTGKSQPGKIYSLSDFSGRSETRKMFNTYIKEYAKENVNHVDVKYMRELAGVKSKALDVISEGAVIDGVVGYRLGLNENTSRIFGNITQINNKGVSAVKQNLVGPSVFNQLGHKFVDSLNYEYSEVLINTAKKYGLDVKVYQSAPMQLAYKFDNMADPKTIQLVLEESEKAFSKSLRKKGFNKLRTFYNSSTTYTSDVSKAVNSNINLTSRLERKVVYSDEIISNVNTVLAQHSIGMYYNSLLEGIPKSVRNIDDLSQELISKGYKPKDVSNMIEAISELY